MHHHHGSFFAPKQPASSSSCSSSTPYARRPPNNFLPRPRRMNGSSSSSSSYHDSAPNTSDPSFDVLEWHPAYLSCIRYFLDHAQHEPATQALCALINIRLPHQWHPHPISTSQPPRSSTPSNNNHNTNNNSYPFNSYPTRNGTTTTSSSTNGFSPSTTPRDPPPFISLVPYLRRLIVTAFDKPAILHGFFGDDYIKGVMPHVECERRNYLFAAKHGGWRSCKKQYDSGSGGAGGDEGVPFLKPLDESRVEELVAAEKAWSAWLCMEDWMVGPRAPGEGGGGVQQQPGGRGAGRERERVVDQLPDGVPGELSDGFSPRYDRH